MSHHLKLHVRKIAALAMITLIALAVMVTQGDLVATASIKWTDVLGEGGGALMVLLWFLLILMGRPRGRVTNLLALGLGCLFMGMWVDTLDEFFKLPATLQWSSAMESVPMLLGWAVTTFGIYAWHREQLAIGRQLRTRERDIRDHRHFDPLTPVSRVAYFMAQTEHFRSQGTPAAVLDMDIIAFRKLNAIHGADACDRVLQSFANVLAINLRDGDLVCRKGGDHFSVLLPDTTCEKARQIAGDLRTALESTCFHDLNDVRMDVKVRARTMSLEPSYAPAQAATLA